MHIQCSTADLLSIICLSWRLGHDSSSTHTAHHTHNQARGPNLNVQPADSTTVQGDWSPHRHRSQQPPHAQRAGGCRPKVAQGAGQVRLVALREHARQLALGIQVAHVRKPLVVQHLLVPGGPPALPAGGSQASPVHLPPSRVQGLGLRPSGFKV